MAAAQSQITHALLIQFEFIHHKPVMIHEFRDHLVWDSRRSRAMRCSSSARYRCLLSRRGSTASSPKTAEVLTRIWSEQAALSGGADVGSSTSQPEETDQPTYPWSRS